MKFSSRHKTILNNSNWGIVKPQPEPIQGELLIISNENVEEVVDTESTTEQDDNLN